MPEQNLIDSKLDEWGIFDAALSPLQRQERYARFEGVDFGLAPKEEEWSSMRRLLLPYEGSIACHQTDVRKIAKPGFKFHLDVPEHVEFMQKPLPYDAPRQAWLDKEVARLVESGVLERAPNCRCASAVVLVDQGQ